MYELNHKIVYQRVNKFYFLSAQVDTA